MPYSNLGELPDHVRAMPTKKQRIWMATFNSAWNSYDSKKHKAESREAYAFAVANSVVKKSVDNSFEVIQIAEAEFWKDANGDMFMKVPISGVVDDRQGDTASKNCGDGIIRQLKSGIVPLYGDHGVDKNGNKTYSWKNILGKWVDGGWHENNLDVMATARLNKAHPDAITLFEFGVQKMPMGFSIGGNIIRTKEERYENC